MDNFMGILGAEIISRFDVILDYSNKNIYIKPNRSFSDNFSFPLSGISLRKIQNEIIVIHVDKASPAYTNGLRRGDRIISLNEDTSKNFKAYKNILNQEGRKISLICFDKNEKRKQVSFTLKKLL